MANGPVTGKPVPKIKFTRENILGSISGDDLSYQTQDRMKASMARRTAFGNVGAKTSASGNKGVSGTGSSPLGKKKINWKRALDETKPYLSNIANSFASVPKPSVPGLTNMVNIPRVNLNNARNVVERSARSTDLQASRSLDENTAASVHQATLANKIQGMNDIADREANANAQIAGQQAQINAGIDSSNVATMNQYRDNVTNSAIATQRERSGNLANASDKAIAIDNEKARGQLELLKWQNMSALWKKSGVYDRKMKELKKAGIDNPVGINEDGTMVINRLGGQLRRVFGGGGELPPPGKPSVLKAHTDYVNSLKPIQPSYNFTALQVGNPSSLDSFNYRSIFGQALVDPQGTVLKKSIPAQGLLMNAKTREDELKWATQLGNTNNAITDAEKAKAQRVKSLYFAKSFALGGELPDKEKPKSNTFRVFPKFGVAPAQAMKDIAARNGKTSFKRGGFLKRKSVY